MVDELVGTTIRERFEIIKFISSGAFGKTYLGIDKDNPFKSQCLVKYLCPINPTSIEIAKKLFENEASCLSTLGEHPQIPRLLSYFEEEEKFFLVQELVKGQDLTSEFSSGERWSEGKTVEFLQELLSILSVVHQNNTIHRDIKPANIMRCQETGKLVLIDFGAVKESLRLDQTGMTMFSSIAIGTPPYMSPEQAMAKPEKCSDIYAVGVLGIQALTGLTSRELINLSLDSDNLEGIFKECSITNSFQLKYVLGKMVSFQCKQRYVDADEASKALEPTIPVPSVNPDNPENSRKLLGSRNSRTRIQNHFSTNDSRLLTTTKIKNQKTNIRFLYLPVIITLSLLGGGELFKPWIRPLYHLSQGNKLLDKNHLGESLSQFQKVINLKRNSAPAWKGRGDVLFNQRRYSGALAAYNQAISIDPKNVKALNNKGKILSQQGQFPQAINVYKKAINVDSGNAEVWSGMGLAYMSMQQNEEALKSFNQAQSIKPDEPKIWIQKGIILRALDRSSEASMFYQEALAVYDEATTTKEKNNPLVWTDRGFVLLQLNLLTDAFASFDSALKLDENYYEAILGKANVHSIKQEYQKALGLFDRAKEIRPQDHQIWNSRGNILLQALNKPEEALASFQQATQLKEDFYPALLGQGLSLSALQKYDEAKDIFDHAKKLNSQDPSLWLNLGIVLEKSGEFDSALEAYQTAAIELKYQPASDYLNQLQQKMGS